MLVLVTAFVDGMNVFLVKPSQSSFNDHELYLLKLPIKDVNFKDGKNGSET